MSDSNWKPASLPQNRSVSWAPHLLSVALFVMLWLTDHPKPMWDDLFFYGASHHLVQTSECANPLLVRQEFLSRYFFAYPPLCVYFLAGWMAVFGISAASVTAFFAAACTALSSVSIVLTRTLGASRAFQCLIPIAAAAAFLDVGLRPEISATVFFMAGMVITVANPLSRWRAFWGSFFLVLAVATAPRWVSFAAVFVAFLGWEFWRSPREARGALMPLVGFAVLGALLVLLLFAFAIDFRVAEFWQTFHIHALERTAAQSKRVVLEQFVRVTAGPSRWPLMILAGGWLLRRCPPVTKADRLAWCLAGAFPLAVLGGSLGHGATWFLALIVLFLAGQGFTRVSTCAKVWPWASAAAVLVLANARPICEITAEFTGAIVAEQSASYADARAVQSLPGRALLVDSSAARYLYDYRLPDGCLDFQFAAKFPGIDVTMDPIRPTDTYVVGPLGEARLEEQGWRPPQLRTIRPLGSLTIPLFARPREIFVVTGAECQERLKSATRGEAK